MGSLNSRSRPDCRDTARASGLRRPARAGLIFVLLCAFLSSGGTSSAAEKIRPFSRNEKIFLGGTSVVLGLFEIRKEFLTPTECRWCEPNDFDDFFRNNIRRDTLGQRRAAARASDVTGFGSGFLLVGWTALAAHGGNHEEIETNTLTIVQSAVLSLGVDHVVKRVFARQRPHVRTPGDPSEVDDNLSFYSGHTTLAFSVAAAAGRMADLQGYHSAPLIWGTGLTLAAATGYFRMAADEHYMTDVLVGAATGTVVGLLVANHRKEHALASEKTGLQIVVRTDGINLALGFR